MAPQVKRGLPYNEKCDIWSIGCVFYILLAFDMPFANDNDDRAGKYKVEGLKTRSAEARDLVRRMLTVDEN